MVFLFLFFLLLFAFGKEDIRELIEKVKKAPSEERYIHMNKLKMKLMEMYEEKREKIIRRLYREFGREHHEREIPEREMYEHEREMEREIEREYMHREEREELYEEIEEEIEKERERYKEFGRERRKYPRHEGEERWED